MNNCVGVHNHKQFVQFIVYTLTGLIYAVVMTAWRGVQCVTVHPVKARRINCMVDQMFGQGPWGMVLTVVSFVMAIFFCIFVCCMAWEQGENIQQGYGNIDKMQGKEGSSRFKKRGFFEKMKDVCFEPVGTSWLLPNIMGEATYHAYVKENDPVGDIVTQLETEEERYWDKVEKRVLDNAQVYWKAMVQRGDPLAQNIINGSKTKLQTASAGLNTGLRFRGKNAIDSANIGAAVPVEEDNGPKLCLADHLRKLYRNFFAGNISKETYEIKKGLLIDEFVANLCAKKRPLSDDGSKNEWNITGWSTITGEENVIQQDAEPISNDEFDSSSSDDY